MSGNDDWKRGARPLAGRERHRSKPETGAGPAPAPAEFAREPDGAGRRADVSRRQLADLRRGRWPAESELDLHGLDAREARAAVRRLVAEAGEAGRRCVRVVHGRGLHSEDGAVLRERLPDWLGQGPAAEAVLAWCPEARSRGGATLVLLRRPARRRPR